MKSQIIDNDDFYNYHVEKGIITPVDYIYSNNSVWFYDINLSMYFLNTGERNNCVYVHLLPMMIYIGQTGQNVEDRWKLGEGYKNNKLFYINIKKYGWDNIIHGIVKKNLTKEESDRMERELIRFYSTHEKDTKKVCLNLQYNF